MRNCYLREMLLSTSFIYCPFLIAKRKFEANLKNRKKQKQLEIQKIDDD